MKQNKQEQALRAMEHLDDALILSAMNESDLEGVKPNRIEKRRNHMNWNTSWKKWVAAAAMLAIVFATCLVFGLRSGSAQSIIALDVNPSIEIEINRDEEIVAVHALNEEARIVIGEMNLKDVDLDVAINAIIGAMVKNGYLSEKQNSILVSVDSKNATKATALKEKLSGEINALLGESNIQASVILQSFEKNDETGKKADENKISQAKATLISKIIAAGLLDANGVPYSYGRLAELKVNELKLILESKSLTVDGIVTSGTASNLQYLTRDQVLELALAKAGLAAAGVRYMEIELDYDDDLHTMVYEVELYADGLSYEYEIHAVNGNILEEEIEQKDKEVEPPAMVAAERILSREAALAAAYADAGVSADAVRRPEIEPKLENGVYVYEIEFKTADKEYEYLIHAQTGEILNREVEPRE